MAFGDNKISKFYQQMLLISLTLATFCFVYPFLIFLFGSLLTYRYMIEIIVKKSDRKFGPTLKGLDSLFAAKTPYTNPESVTITRLYLESVVNKSDLLSTFNERIIHHWDNQGNLVYGRLRKRIVSKFGYQFWYAVDNFNLSDHIRYLDENCPERVVKESEMMELVSKWSKLPFFESHSPWEILLIPNYIHETEKDSSIKSIMITRMHHGLCDGFSLSKLYQRLGKELPPPPPTSIPKVENSVSFSKWIWIVAKGTYEVLKYFLSINVDENPWVRKAVTESTQKVAADQTSLIAASKLKNIVQKSGKDLSVGAVIMTAFLQSAAKLMYKRNCVNEPITNMGVLMPWPLPNHPGGLSNHFTSAAMNISVDINDVQKTARNVSQEFERLRARSVMPQFMALVLDLMGSLPTKWVIKSNACYRSTVVFSNFPGPSQAINICGSNVRDLFGAPGPGAPCAVAALACSYNGKFRYMAGGDQCNLTSEDATYLVATIEKVIDELGQLYDSARTTRAAGRNNN